MTPPVLRRLREIANELGSLYREVGQIEMAAEQARTQVWRHGEGSGTPVTTLRELARANAADFTVDAIVKKAEIQALIAERDFLTACVQVGVLDLDV